MTLHIAVDLDDVVVDFMHGVIASFELEYGVKVKYDGGSWGTQAVEFSQHPLFKESGYSNWWGWLRDREWLWAQFPAVDGAIGSIKRLRERGHYLEAVTSKPEWAEHNVWKWLGKWRVPVNAVTIVNSTQRKLDFTDAQVIIDDKYETCRTFAEAGRQALWFDRSVPKRQEHLPVGLHQVSGWAAAMDTIDVLDGLDEKGLICSSV